jgi:hypothetical protein
MGELDNAFGGLAFQEVALGPHVRLLQPVRHSVQVGFRFSTSDLPIQRIDRAGLPGQVNRVHHVHERDLRLENPGQGDDVRQNALGQRRAVYRNKDVIEHLALLVSEAAFNYTGFTVKCALTETGDYPHETPISSASRGKSAPAQVGKHS